MEARPSELFPLVGSTNPSPMLLSTRATKITPNASKIIIIDGAEPCGHL